MIFFKYKQYIPIGISLPKEIVNKIDELRKDVPRSRYILRLLENSIHFLRE